ncbi:MAG: GAF domain-containing protein [Candidatus Marinimicrobia bacterium]|nr:GAF domain-containing protein [Candidatus Neomarinimicrobiota bacterium]MCF7828541.1 GAF domain-containing protein [Candidatus Neomarinimicrobiota bacterium]MCF7882036.1 GAF domain-containing protein [Candidatus Neomarinimicrobiota bacterium]
MTRKSEIKKVLKSGWVPYPEDHLDEILNDASPAIQECIITLAERVQKLSEIGTALSAERNLPRLLEKIVDEARNLTNADGGSIYLMSDDETELYFEIAQTTSLGIRMGGTSGKMSFPPIPLYNDDGTPNHSNTSTHCALTGEIVNIPDVYAEDGEFDFSGPKRFDEANDYRTRSQLSVPFRNHENEIIGVLQLINAQDPDTGEFVAFSNEAQELTASLASQAAVAITNTRLIQDLENLFESLIQVIAAAVDEKSPYTGGHIERVANLTMRIAEVINETDEGELGQVHFDEDEMKELRIAAWLHDLGKITTPEYVVDKSTKLETIYDKVNAVRLRYEIKQRDAEIERLKKKLETANGQAEQAPDTIDEQIDERKKTLEKQREWIKVANIGGEYITDEKKERIEQIAKQTYELEGEEYPLLEPVEVKNLKIGRGTLNEEERQIIQNHAAVSKKMLEKLPYPKKLRRIPEYAGAHHEKLDGSGYPDGLTEDELPMQARIMALADVFEALTAEDRPYKPGKQLSEAMKILGFMVKDHHIDDRLFRLFIDSGLVKEYALEHVKPKQIDYLEYDEEGKPIPETENA